jgi:phospholipid transport system substrate-binding protein
MNKTSLSLWLYLVSAAVFASTVPDSRAPEQIVKESTAHILSVLESQREELAANPEQLQKLVNDDLLPLIDTEYSARLILGRAGRNVSAEQLAEFSRAMSETLLTRYAEGLLNFRSDEQVEVLPLRGKQTDKLTRVRTRIKLNEGGYIPIDYAFHMTDQGWKAFDITIEGISYVITLRNQIAPRVTADGIEKVTADIRAGNIKLEG